MGIRVTKLGRTSVTYNIGIFGLPGACSIEGVNISSVPQLCAQGNYVHVYVDGSGKPTSLPAHTRTTLQALCEEADTMKTGDSNTSDLMVPPAYLAEVLEPQGVHKLWVEGQDHGLPMVSTKLFEQGNTMGVGLWECTPGSWSITRETTESFLVLHGKATLREADGSLREELRPGMWHTTPSGWCGSWEVHETVRKLFVLSP